VFRQKRQTALHKKPSRAIGKFTDRLPHRAPACGRFEIRLATAVLAGGLAAFLVGCGGANSASGNAPETPAASAGGGSAPTPVAMGAAPAKRKAPPAAGGEKSEAVAMFKSYCAQCHNIGTVGKPGGIPLTHIGKTKSAEWLTVQIRHPEQHHTRMPAFPPSVIPDAKLKTMVNYLESLK
jgi:mono/diheme cytochrome c family protein